MTLVDIAKGEPDFHTPEHVKRAAWDAIQSNFTKYTPQPGIPELREAVARKFRTENNIDAAPEDVVIACGGKHVVEMAIRSLIRPGDEAIMMTPHWNAYPGQVRLAGGTPIFVEVSESCGFLPDIEAISTAISPRTRLLIINSPANPTGAVYPAWLLEHIAALAVEKNLHVLSDEVYEKIVFNGTAHISIASLGKEISLRTVTVGSTSKTHAMTGWRIGYGLLPAGLAGRVINIVSISTSAPSSISQRAALAALTGDQSHIAAMTAAYAARRDFLLDRIASIECLSAVPPKGAFYCFVNISRLIGRVYAGARINNADDFAHIAQEAGGVRVLSGVAFGSPEHIRISFAVSQQAIEEGMKRLAHWIGSGD